MKEHESGAHQLIALEEGIRCVKTLTMVTMI